MPFCNNYKATDMFIVLRKRLDLIQLMPFKYHSMMNLQTHADFKDDFSQKPNFLKPFYHEFCIVDAVLNRGRFEWG